MTKEEFIVQIQLQKERGDRLLNQVQQIHVYKNNYGDGMAVFGQPKLFYTPKKELHPIEAEYDSWKEYVHDFLLSALDENDSFIAEWNECLHKPYLTNISDKQWYESEIQKALSKLDSFVQRIGFRLKDEAPKDQTRDEFSIIKLIKEKFEAGQYSDALITALKEVNVIVKKKVRMETGKEQDGPSLMRTAFNVDNPVIKLNSLSSISETDEQRGYSNLFAGAMEALRNPMSHANIEITKEDALRKLYFVSMLMYKLYPNT